MNVIQKALLLSVFSLLIVGCAQQQNPSDNNINLSNMTQNVSDEPDNESEDLGMKTVAVTQDEWNLTLSDNRVDAGMLRFKIENAGNYRHEFAIRGPDREYMLEEGIPAGENSTYEVELTKGNYTVYCTIPTHAQKGEEAELKVQ